MLVVPGRLTRLVALGSLVGMAILAILVASIPRQSSQSKPPSRYSYPAHPNKSNLSRVRVRGRPALTLTATKPIRWAPRYPITYKMGVARLSYAVSRSAKVPFEVDICRAES